VMSFTRRVELSCTVSDAFAALHNPEVFQSVSKPFLRFTPLAPAVFPQRYETGKSYVVRARAFGVVPLGTQEINPITSRDADRSVFTDNGRGLSGALGVMRQFHHTMTLEPSGRGPTVLVDRLEWDAGFLSPAFYVGFRFFWWWRHRVMKRLAPGWRNPRTASWEARYQSATMWSGRVNPTLVSHAPSRPGGTALDVGAGEGADALWLAEQGYSVTAVDASTHAVARGEAERVRRNRADGVPRVVRWIAADVISDDLPQPVGGYDFVVAHFLHLPSEERAVIWGKLVGAVAPGGTLLIVGHHEDDLAAGIRRPPRELLFDERELASIVPSSWTQSSVQKEKREQKVAGSTTVTVADIVLVAAR
jgi:SAM-dependent methyltransferase